MLLTHIVDAQPGHVSMLTESIREADARECEGFGLLPRRAIWKSFRQSIIRKSAFVDGEIAAMWGIGGNIGGAVGEIWLLTAQPIERIPFTFYRQAKIEVGEGLELFPKLQGILALSHQRAVAFVTSLGFTLLPLNEHFALFEKSRA